MKKLIILSAALMVVASMAWSAQDVGVGGAYWKSKDLEDGMGITVKYQWQFEKNFSLEPRLSYLSGFGEDPEELNIIPIELGINYLMPLTDKVTAKAGAGIGYYMLDYSVETLVGVEADNKVGFFGVLGGEVKVTQHVSIFGEVMYRKLDITTSYLASGSKKKEFDQSLSGLGINAGLSFPF